MTIRWLTDADRAELARRRRECLERDELFWLYCRWLDERAGHPGGVLPVPPLPPETAARLLELLRQQNAVDSPG
ncbi:hypothetical protein [Geodermatophilus sp. URMC 64]